jgi:aminopeptidase N
MICADARDGMEYPMLTLDGGLSPGYYGLIAHEVGHNWFFGMVGNNETYRASLDEGFTQFLTSWSMTKLFAGAPENKRKGYVAKHSYSIPQMDQSVYNGYLRDAMKQEDAALNTHSDDFNSALNHGGGYGHVYYKTATMLYNLQYVLGDELFLAAMQHYFNQWKMAHPYFEDFRASIIHYTHVDLNWFFDQWLETTKTIDYAVLFSKKSKGVKGPNGGEMHDIHFIRKGSMQMPVDFTVQTKDSTFRYLIPNTYYAKKESGVTVLPYWKGWGKLNRTYTARVELPAGSKVKNVVIDPTARLADIEPMDNSLKAPVRFTFDHQIHNPADRRNYILKWRPDVWYNSVDGVKAGLHFNGNYMNYRNVFSATAWYNTGLGNDGAGAPPQRVNFNYTGRHGIVRDYYMNVNARILDGLRAGRFGFEKVDNRFGIFMYLKVLYRKDSADLRYLLYPELWQPHMRNNTLNLELHEYYSYGSGSGTVRSGLRASMFSDYDYSSLWSTWINQQDLWKFELRSRLHAVWIRGSNIAPESQVMLAGANNEDMMDNKFVRSRAFVPEAWLGYGTATNHFQFGGGLNVRGYSGYLVPVNKDNVQYYLFTGTAGAAVNLELDFDRLVRVFPRLGKYFHFDTYLFADAGAIGNVIPAGTSGLTENKFIESPIMGSAGAGVCFTIKKWGFLDDPKPLTIRFDMPVFLSSAPFVEQDNFKFRWVVGIGRSF